MKRRIEEETIIFISVIKWVVLATIIGLITGFSTTLYIKALNWSIELGGSYRYYFLLLPLGVLISAFIVKYLSPEGKIPGANLAIEAVNRYSGKIKPIIVPIEFAASIITIATGGSAGKEGPSVQIGGGLASIFSDLVRFEGADRKKLVICGICGGFASVFGAPLSGALYGLEVLAAGALFYEVLLPAFVTGLVSYHVSSAMGIAYFYHPIKIVPVFSDLFFLKVVIAGIFFGFCSFLLIEAFALGKAASARMRLSWPVKSLFAGALLAALAFFISEGPLGLSLKAMESSIAGAATPWYDFLLKMLYTSITLNFGGTGGKITPILFIGATSGNAISRLLNVDPPVFAAIGFVSLLAGASNTPIAASVMAVELFGSAIAPYAAVASVISFIITGHRSVYPSQLLAMRKSYSIDVELGNELSGVTPKYSHRKKSLIGLIRRLFRKQ